MKISVFFLALFCLHFSASERIHVTGSNYSFSYEVTRFGECRAEEGRLRIFLNVPIAECVTECVTRPHCLALSFSRQMNTCEIFGPDGDGLFSRRKCLYVTRSAIKDIKLPCTECQNGESCDVTSSECVKEECVIPRLDNGKVLGNLRSIGARIMYECNYGWNEKNGIRGAKCLESATWSDTAECTKHVVFRIVAGNGINTWEAWSTGSGSTNDLSCVFIQNNNCASHYRDPMLDDWTKLNPRQIRYSIYKDGNAVAWVSFNGVGTNMTNWFDQSRVMSSSYNDVTAQSKFNHFGIHPEIHGVSRNFYISKSFDGCENDVLNIGIFDSEDTCAYGKKESANMPAYPLIFYSTKTVAVTTSTTDFFGYADTVTVSVFP